MDRKVIDTSTTIAQLAELAPGVGADVDVRHGAGEIVAKAAALFHERLEHAGDEKSVPLTAKIVREHCGSPSDYDADRAAIIFCLVALVNATREQTGALDDVREALDAIRSQVSDDVESLRASIEGDFNNLASHLGGGL